MPTYSVNSGIVLKELTLNQYAWSEDEDYQEGYLMNGLINVDILYWIGVNEDREWYIRWLK